MAYDGEVRDHEPQHLRVLRKTRDLLAIGWCQGGSGMQDHDGRTVRDSNVAAKFCVMTALAHVISWEGVSACREREVLYQRILGALRPGKRILDRLAYVTWNDAQFRTQEQVVRLFDDAIAHVQAEQLEVV